MTPQSAATAFGRLLRFWRKVHGTSQEELALELDSATSHISRLENGKSSPGRDMILRIADYFSLGQRDRAQLLFTAGFAPETEPVEFGSEDAAWLRRFCALALHALEPHPAMLLQRFDKVLMFNRAWLGMLGPSLLNKNTEPNARLYLDFLFSSYPHENDNLRLEVISGVLMTMQQLALIWEDANLDALVSDLAGSHDLPHDWRRNAAAVEPRATIGLQLPVDGQLHRFLHESHSVDPLGPAMTVGQSPIMMVSLLPLQHDLDLSAWQSDADHPLLCDNFL